jgi:ribosomal protein S18 acetylase RimI-like enzyme
LIKEIDILNKNSAEIVLQIQLIAYEIEAEIIGFYEIPTLRDTVESLQQSGERFFGYYQNETLCGVVSLKIEDAEIDIHRLFVHPNYFRKGIAQRLLDFLKSSFDASLMKVATGSKNTPAIGFYLKNGFQKVREIDLAEGINLSFFEMKLGDNGSLFSKGDELICGRK